MKDSDVQRSVQDELSWEPGISDSSKKAQLISR